MKISKRLKDELKKDLLKRLHEEGNTVIVTSAAPLSDSELESIKKAVEADKNTKFTVTVDPALLAGVVIQKGSRILDLSVRSKLDNLRTQIV